MEGRVGREREGEVCRVGRAQECRGSRCGRSQQPGLGAHLVRILATLEIFVLLQPL
jgi:hypothetical protein